jgi:trimeric autotransporter adhesin
MSTSFIGRRNRSPFTALALVASLSITAVPGGMVSSAFAQCTPRWEAVPLEQRGGQVSASATFDAGNGPELYIAGAIAGFDSPQGVRRADGLVKVRRVNGAFVYEAAPVQFNGNISQMITYNDGRGPNGGASLYVLGSFTQFEDQGIRVAAERVARWDGTRWHAAGGLRGSVNGVGLSIASAAVHDDGSGPKLYVGGTFSQAVNGSEAVLVNNIAAWDGVRWSPLGSGTDVGVWAGTNFVRVSALVSSNFTGSSRLYVGGAFTTAGGVATNGLASWNGSAFQSAPAAGEVRAMTVFTESRGTFLFIAGAQGSLSRWDGRSSSFIGISTDGLSIFYPNQLIAFNDGVGPHGGLYLVGGVVGSRGGETFRNLLRYDGVLTLSSVSGGVARPEFFDQAFAANASVADFGDGPVLALGGVFSRVGGPAGQPAGGFAAWTGTQWQGAPALIRSNQPAVYGIAGGEGNRPLVVSGDFALAGAASFDGTGAAEFVNGAWRPLGPVIAGGVQGSGFLLIDEVAYGESGALYLAGAFGVEGTHVNSVARRTGGVWSGYSSFTPATFSQLGANLTALAPFTDSQGEAAYIGGRFNTIDGVTYRGIAEVRGTSATPLNPLPPVRLWPESIVIREENGRRVIYVASIGVTDAGGVFRFDGQTWTQLGPAFTTTSLAFFRGPDGNEQLYAAGPFAAIGDQAIATIARWDGTRWNRVGGGVSRSSFYSHAMKVFDDGTGPALYLTGPFDQMGEGTNVVLVDGIARWDGRAWSAVRGGLGLGASGSALHAVIEADASGVERSWLYAGGEFRGPRGLFSSGIARFGGCPPCVADFDRNGEVDFFDYLEFVAAFSNEQSRADINDNGVVDFFDYLDFAALFEQGC